MNNKTLTVLINNLNPGGAEKVCVIICNEFVNLGYEVKLWLVSGNESPLFEMLNPAVSVVSLNKTLVRNALSKLSALLFKEKPPVLLCFNTELAVMVSILLPFTSINTRLVVRSINTLSNELKQLRNSNWKKYISYPIINHFYNKANSYIAQSEGIKADLIQSFGVKSDKITVIPNPAFVFNQYNTNIVRSENELLFVGRLEKQKALDVMLDAVKSASHKVTVPFKLVIVGDGTEKNSLLQKVDELELNDYVQFEGFQADTSSYFKRAKATLLSSMYEGFPNVLVESVKLGTPVISFDCPSGPSEIIVPLLNGILVPNKDVEAFSNAIVSVLTNEIVFSEQEVIRTSERFDKNEIIKMYEDLLFEK